MPQNTIDPTVKFSCDCSFQKKGGKKDCYSMGEEFSLEEKNSMGKENSQGEESSRVEENSIGEENSRGERAPG